MGGRNGDPKAPRPGPFPSWSCAQRGWCSTGAGMCHQPMDLVGTGEVGCPHTAPVGWGGTDGTCLAHTDSHMCPSLAHTHTSTQPQAPPSLFPPPQTPPHRVPASSTPPPPRMTRPLPWAPNCPQSPSGVPLCPAAWPCPLPAGTALSPLGPRGHPRTPKGTRDNNPGGLRESGDPGCAPRPPSSGAGWGCQLEAIY